MASTDLALRARENFGGHKVIDVDTHLSEPHDLWTSRAPAALRDRVPQIRPIDGRNTWVIDGDTPIAYASNPTSVVLPDGSKVRGYDWFEFDLADVHPASTQVAARLAYMDSQGISAQIVYPNVLGFGGQRTAQIDPALRLASVEIFNDAMAEFQEESGGRMFPMALMPWWDVGLTLREAERCHAMGLRGININTDPQLHPGLDGQRLPDLAAPYWNPLWELCEALSLPINFHVGSSDVASADWFGTQGWPSLDPRLVGAVSSSMLYHQNARVLGNLLCSGIAERYPGIRFVSVESGIGWIPNFLETIDYQAAEMAAQNTLSRRPSEYFRTNFFATFWFERQRLAEMIRWVGVDNVMFETDFPHPTCLLPIDDVDGAMDGLTYEEKDRIFSGTAAGLYRIAL